MEQEQLELKTLQYLVQDKNAQDKLKKRITGLRLSLFDKNEASKKVADWIARYSVLYNDIPQSPGTLLSFSAPFLKLIEEPLRSWCEQLIEQVYQPLNRTETFEFCVDQLTINWTHRTSLETLYLAVADLKKNDFDSFTNQLGEIIKRVKSIDTISHVMPIENYGKILADTQYRAQHPELNRKIETGIGWLDEAFGGGLSIGEYYLVMAYTGRGKSFLGTQLAFHAAWAKHNVVVANLEMSNKKATHRLLSRLTAIPYIRFAQPWHMTAENYETWKTKAREWEEEKRGRLDFISFNKIPTVEDIIAKMEELDVDIDLLIIDQITNMSSKLEWQELEVIAKKLEWLAKTWKKEKGLAIVTFGQVKSETKNYAALTEQHFAYGKAVCEHATGVIYMTQTEQDEARNVIRMGICKNRDGESSRGNGLLYPNFSISRIHCQQRFEQSVNDGDVPT